MLKILRLLIPGLDTASAPVPVFESRWGYHSISREDYLLLKALRKRFWRAIYKAAAWTRWSAKAPHNRHGNEPKLDELVHDREAAWERLEKSNDFIRRYGLGGPSSRTKMWCWNVPLANSAFGSILSDFKASRPVKRKKDVTPIGMEKYQAIYQVKC